MRYVLLYFSYKYNGDWDKIYYALQNKEKISEKEIKLLKDKKIKNFITVLDKNYPKQFKKIKKPPFVIFYKGNKKLLKLDNYIWPYGLVWENNFNENFEKIFTTRKEKTNYILGNSNKFEKNFLLNFLKLNQKSNVILIENNEINDEIIFNKNVNYLILSEHPERNEEIKNDLYYINRLKISFMRNMFLLNFEENNNFKNLFIEIYLLKKNIYFWYSIKYKYNLDKNIYNVKNVGDIKTKWQKI